jgi:hypothetical protein
LGGGGGGETHKYKLTPYSLRKYRASQAWLRGLFSYIYEKMPKEIKIFFYFLPRALKTIKQQSGLLVSPRAKIRKKEN